MNKIAFGLAAATFAAVAAGEASANINAFKGTWVNVNPSTSGVTKLRILKNGGLVRIRAFGQCHPTDCNWGVVRAIPFGPSVAANPLASTRALMATFAPSFARKIVIVERAGLNRLRVKVLTRFVDGSGRKPYVRNFIMRRVSYAGPPVHPGPIVPPGPGVHPVKEDCVKFSPYTTKVRKIGGAWKLVDGSHWIKHFGPKAGEAFKTLAIIKRYKLNRLCFVGRPGPSMEYFKRYGALPAGFMPGQDCLAINPRAMRIRPIGGRFVLVQGNRLHKSFPSYGEARKGLIIMRKLGARFACYVGRPGPSATYLKR